MRHYFIDLENVRSAGLEGVLSLEEDDRVYVFYSDNANTLTIPTLESINGSKAKVKYIKTNYTGSNAMDFQIVAMYGAVIEREKTGSFYIISHDNGFKSAVSFCNSYFSEYDIKLGAYATIMSTLNVIKDKKANDLKVSAGEKATDDKAETEGKMPVKKKRPARKKSVNGTVCKGPDNINSTNNIVSSAGVGKATESANSGKADDKGKTTGKPVTSKPLSNTSSKSINSGKPQALQEKLTQEQSMDYIYDILSPILSKTTIDVYAEAIHEGIQKAHNRREIHNYFNAKYGTEEGEALYHIVQGDFDKMKARTRIR